MVIKIVSQAKIWGRRIERGKFNLISRGVASGCGIPEQAAEDAL